MKLGPYVLDRNELAGALGDIGIFVPIVAALVTFNGVNATLALLVAGLLYIAAGLYFKIPVPVQPLKAVAAIAIASGVGPAVLSAAGIWMGAILILLAATGLINRIDKVLSRPIVRGIQLALGLTLFKTGYELLTKKELLMGGPDFKFSVIGLSIPAGLVIGLIGFVLILALKTNRRWPASLTVLSIGMLVGVLARGQNLLPSLRLGPEYFQIGIPKTADFVTALTLLVIPQIPLTLANSISATSSTAKAYFKEGASRLSPRALACSLGATNLVSGFVGGMPFCHGAGGMTAHYKFGARTGGSNLIIGSVMIAAALVMGKSAMALMSVIPLGVYGILLIYLGIEHAILISDAVYDTRDLFVALSIAALSVASGNLFIAVVSGIILNLLMRLLSKREVIHLTKPQNVL